MKKPTVKQCKAIEQNLGLDRYEWFVKKWHELKDSVEITLVSRKSKKKHDFTISKQQKGSTMENNNFKVGDYIVYSNRGRYEIGKVKRVCSDGCFVNYHSGETAAKTHFRDMHKLINSCYILKTSLGGSV